MKLMVIRQVTKHTGFTLLEILVGLVITLIGVLTMVAMYQQAGSSGAELKQSAYIDGQIQVGLLAADRILQNAGYKQVANINGKPSEYVQDLMLFTKVASAGGTFTNAAGVPIASVTNSDVAGQLLVWRLDVGAGDQFEGLYAPASGGLSYWTGDSLNPTDGSWQRQSTLIPVPNNNQGIFDHVGLVTMTLSSTNTCTPFGLSGAGMTGLHAVRLSVQREKQKLS
ncbi:MAG: type II secretion system protein [Reinekea sp.]